MAKSFFPNSPFLNFAVAENENRRCPNRIPLPPPSPKLVNSSEEDDPYDVVCWIVREPIAKSETSKDMKPVTEKKRNDLRHEEGLFNHTHVKWNLYKSESPALSEKNKKRHNSV